MEKRYEIDTKEKVDATITNRCMINVVKEVYDKLDKKHRTKLENSCFGPLLKLRKIKLASQLVHQLILRLAKTNKKKETWFIVGNKLTRFGLHEFVLVTGLNAGSFGDVDKTNGIDSLLVKGYFKNSRGKITRLDVYNAFDRCKKRPTDKYKLGLLVILSHVVLAAEENTFLHLWWFDLVDDLERFDKYPWGKMSFEYTIRVLKRDLTDVLKAQHCRYTLFGFPLALMVWAFEAIPALGNKFATKHADGIPRMVAWEMQKRLMSAPIDLVLESRELEVKSTLLPIENELREVYWQELVPLVEEDDTTHNLEGEEVEQDVVQRHSIHQQSPREAQPPSVSNEMNLVAIIRTEMKRVEGRLLGVISTRLDRIERKIDRLIELVVAGRSHSTPSAFDGATSSATYVLEDDSMDVARNENAEKECGEEIERGTEVEVEVELGEEGGKMNEKVEEELVEEIEVEVEKVKGKETNFQTPEKLEGDATRSSVGDSVQIHEVESDSSKGRGYHTKRKTQFLCSPSTDPMKRRKLDVVDQYDPYRKVDPKVESLDRWLETASSSQIIPLRSTDVQEKCLTDLLHEDGWLTGSKLEEDLLVLAQKIKHYDDNVKCLKARRNRLEGPILDMQVALGKYHTENCATENENHVHVKSEEKTIEHILRHEKSAAAILCQLKTQHGDQASNLQWAKDVVGIVATLGKVDDDNLSRLLSAYLGLETMLAIVCKTREGVKALEAYDKHGLINRSSGLHGLGSSIGRPVDGPFLVFCLESLSPYVGEFMTNDPQRRLDLLKPRLSNGEPPFGFLGFAVNMITIDSIHLHCISNSGNGLRETLFYNLFSTLQVYKSREDMLKAIPCITNGAISLDGGMVRRPGVFSLGSRGFIDVKFPKSCKALKLPENYFETEKRMKETKWKEERMWEDMQREQALLEHAKFNYEIKKQELVKFLGQSSPFTPQHQYQAGRSAP